MATRTANLVANISANADFRAAVQFLTDVFSDGGFIQQTGIGEINPATVVAPTAAYMVQGYQVWKTSDGYNDVYIKVEYGSGAATASFSLLLSLGTEVSSTGVLGGITSVQIRCNDTSSASAASFTCYGSAAGGSRLQICYFTNSSAAPNAFILSLERPINSSGTPLTNEYQIITSCYYGFYKVLSYQRVDGNLAFETSTSLIASPSTANITYNGNNGLAFFYGARGQLIGPHQNLLGYLVNSHATVGTTYSILHQGTTKNFLALNIYPGFNLSYAGGYLMRYE